MVNYKGGTCVLCGYDRCLRALDFHHLNPATKRFSIAGGHTRSWRALRAELDKCILVCSNCHGQLEHVETGRYGPRLTVTAGEALAHICQICGRQYLYDRRKGHTKRRCNSCWSNRSTPEERHELKRWMIELRGGSCELCGYHQSITVLTFHHVDPTQKRFNIAGGHGRSLAALRAEIEKCVLVCANCHDEIEAGEAILPARVVQAVRRATQHVQAFERQRPGRPTATHRG